MLNQTSLINSRSSFCNLFCLIFVIFSLYLLGDAFYRWDGFSFYGTFSEFLPSVSLVAIFWTILAIIATSLVWLFFRMLQWFSLRTGREIRIEDFFFFAGAFVVMGLALWVGKRKLFPYVQTGFGLKLLILLSVLIIACFAAWFFRKKSGQWVNIILERITPLVWLFSIFIVLSVPTVIYHTFVKHTGQEEIQEPLRTAFSNSDKPNIILITFDALSAKNMSLYGYKRNTTPFMSEWAKSATVFTRLEAESSFTAPTTASLMTGKRVWSHQRFQSHGNQPLRSDLENFPRVLKNNGYTNIALIANEIASINELGMTGSFKFTPPVSDFKIAVSFYGAIYKTLQKVFGTKIMFYDWIINKDFVLYKFIPGFLIDSYETEFPVEIVFNKFFEIADNNLPEPFFVWMHLMPPHANYLPPGSYMGMYDDSPKFRTYQEQDNFFLSFHKYSPNQQPDVDILRARYDGFIKYCDDQFKEFITQLEKRNILENSVVVVSADHGESFEHGSTTHGSLYEVETNIPLIIRVPNQTGGMVVNSLVEQIDIPATILDMTGLPMPSWIEGRSLLPLTRGEVLPLRPAFSMELQRNPSRGHKITKGEIAVWEGDYKLIHDLEKEGSLLFNLKQDPDELSNVINREPEVGQRLRDIIYENLQSVNERIQEESAGSLVITQD